MKAQGQATVMGMSLVIHFEGESWYLSIRRLDGNSDSLFFQYDKQELMPSDLQLFFSEKDMEWTKLPENYFSKCEYILKNDIYRTNLVGNPQKIDCDKLPQIFEEVYKNFITKS